MTIKIDISKPFILLLNDNRNIYDWIYAKKFDESIDPKWQEFGLYREDNES